MDIEHFINFLASITDLSPGFILDLAADLTGEHYKRHQIILGEGQIEDRVWYLKSGLARSYIYDDQEKQYTLRFWNPNEVIFSYAGFLKGPSKEYTELLTESELYSCTYAKVGQLMDDYPEARKIVGAVNRRYLQKDYKRSQLHSLKTKERYDLFKEENPEIFKKVPLWIIASYLHMTRENLSRIISKEK
jgi:CRP-like cAMP-binding protein